MAERVDRIILLFDAHKLDISDEFRRVIEGMRGYDDKIRIVLNKADMVDHQQLMRVYGALMWYVPPSLIYWVFGFCLTDHLFQSYSTFGLVPQRRTFVDDRRR